MHVRYTVLCGLCVTVWCVLTRWWVSSFFIILTLSPLLRWNMIENIPSANVIIHVIVRRPAHLVLVLLVALFFVLDRFCTNFGLCVLFVSFPVELSCSLRRNFKVRLLNDDPTHDLTLKQKRTTTLFSVKYYILLLSKGRQFFLLSRNFFIVSRDTFCARIKKQSLESNSSCKKFST